MQLSITHNFPEVAKALDAMQKDLAAQVLARSLNRTVEQARTAMSKEIRSEFNISAAKVREKLAIKKAWASSGRFTLQATLYSQAEKRHINVINFAARESGDGVSVQIKKRGGRKTIGAAFIGNKDRTVFMRVPGTKMKSRTRYQGSHAERIKPVQTIDVPQMFNTRRINERVLAMIQAKFPEIFQREASWALQRFNRAR